MAPLCCNIIECTVRRIYNIYVNGSAQAVLHNVLLHIYFLPSYKHSLLKRSEIGEP